MAALAARSACSAGREAQAEPAEPSQPHARLAETPSQPLAAARLDGPRHQPQTAFLRPALSPPAKRTQAWRARSRGARGTWFTALSSMENTCPPPSVLPPGHWKHSRPANPVQCTAYSVPPTVYRVYREQRSAGTCQCCRAAGPRRRREAPSVLPPAACRLARAGLRPGSRRSTRAAWLSPRRALGREEPRTTTRARAPPPPLV